MDLFNGTRGPRDARIVIVGEAFGEQERQKNQPFVGASGHLLEQMLVEAGINPKECLFANCIAKKPYGNDMKNLLIPNKEYKKNDPRWLKGIAASSDLQEGLKKLDRLIELVRPKIIIATGNWPTWWLTDKLETKTSKGVKLPLGIDAWRGSQLFTTTSEFYGDEGPLRNGGTPILPILHPASILRMYKNKAMTVRDLRRATAFVNDLTSWVDDTPRNFNLSPTASEVEDWIADVMLSPEIPIINDLETYGNKIHICGLADSPQTGIVIPFFHITKEKTWNYYSRNDAIRIYSALQRLFHSDKMKFVGQNYQYDMQYLFEMFGAFPQVEWDTMIAQHIMFVNLRKGLEYLSSMYCKHHVYWKDERKESLTNEDLEQACDYNATDCWRTAEIRIEQQKVMAQLHCEPRFRRRMEHMRAVLKMSNRGFMINEKLRSQQKMQLFQYAEELIKWLETVIPERVIPETKTDTPWYRSPQQRATVLYDNLGLREVRNPTGGRTTDKEALASLSARYPTLTPIFSALIVLNSIQTIAGNFLSATTDIDNRMRCTFSVAGPITNRLSSKESSFGTGTNLQNIMRPRGPMDMLDQDLV